MTGTQQRNRWNEKMNRYIYPSVGIAGFIICWEMVIVLFYLPEYILPTPYVTIVSFFKNLGALIPHILTTLYETFLGLMFAIIFSIMFSVVVVWFRLVEKTVMPVMVFLQTTPKIAVAPLFLVWFGVGYTPKVVISFWLAYFPIMINMITGLRDVQPEMIDLASSMSASKLQTFIKIRLPNSLPYFFSGLKLGAIVALLGAIVGEYVGADKGLGYLIMWANSSYDVKMLFSVVIALVLLGKAIYTIVEWVEKYMISWHVIARSEEEKFFTA
jgi:NitT/TauT family transport system permease protein